MQLAFCLLVLQRSFGFELSIANLTNYAGLQYSLQENFKKIFAQVKQCHIKGNDR
jgi:hypothetical protein